MARRYTVGQIVQFLGWAGIAWKVLAGLFGFAWLAVSGDSSISGYALFVLLDDLIYAIPFVLLLLVGKWLRRRELARGEIE